MFLYFILIGIIIILRMIFKNNNKKFCISTGIVLWLFLSLRSFNIGLNDTLLVYKPFYESLPQMSITDILNNIWMSEKGFSVLSKFISLFGTDYRTFITICALPFVYCISRFIYKESKYPFLSYIVFISMLYLYGTFLIRQVIAIGICALSIEYIEKKNLKKFLLMVLLASLFHHSAIFMVLAYPFSLKNKFGIKNYVYIILAYISFIFLKKQIISILVSILSQFDFLYKYYVSLYGGLYSTSGNISMFGLLIYIAIIVFCGIVSRKNMDDKMQLYLNISTIGTIFFSFSNIIVESYRIALMFNCVNIVMIPYAISKIEDKKRRTMYQLLWIAFFLLYFFIRTINNVNANPYTFL